MNIHGDVIEDLGGDIWHTLRELLASVPEDADELAVAGGVQAAASSHFNELLLHGGAARASGRGAGGDHRCLQLDSPAADGEKALHMLKPLFSRSSCGGVVRMFLGFLGGLRELTPRQNKVLMEVLDVLGEIVNQGQNRWTDVLANVEAGVVPKPLKHLRGMPSGLGRLTLLGEGGFGLGGG